MDLTSVKYQDSCIYIGLDGSKGQEQNESSLERIKSVYAVYKIKANGNYVRDTILIRKKDITVVRGEIVVKFELNQLHRPDECEIKIVSLKFVHLIGIREELTVNESYSFLEIRTRPPIVENTVTVRKKNKKILSETNEPHKGRKEKLSIAQEIIIIPPEVKILKAANDEQLPLKKYSQAIKEETTVITNFDPPSTTVVEIELKLEQKLDARTKKLEMDVKQLCYETIDALLTVLPQPEFAEDYSSSNTLVQSIHKYITVDLLQKQQEEGESA